MAAIVCATPDCGFGTKGDQRPTKAVHPERCEYREVPLCNRCAVDAAHYGVPVVTLAEACMIITRHGLEVRRQEFFLQFVPAPEESQQEETQAVSS